MMGSSSATRIVAPLTRTILVATWPCVRDPLTPVPSAWVGVAALSVVYIAGDFQGWNPGHPSYALTEQPDGRWNITLTLPDGTTQTTGPPTIRAA